MSKPLVSVIVPTYNVERYVEDCIDSLISQTYPNVEIIVIDDGSKDATVYLLNQYKDMIQLIAHDNNKGQGARRNEGLALASGKYIYFVDSDDWIEPETIEEAVDQLEKTGAELVRFNGVAFRDANVAMIMEGRYDFSYCLKHNEVYDNDCALEVNRRTYSASPCLYIFNKDTLNINNLCFPEGILHEDEYFTTRLLVLTNKMTYLNREFYHRRYRTASTMTESTKAHHLKSFNSYLEVFKKLEAEYKKEEYSEKQKSFIKRQLLSIYNGMLNVDVPPIQKKKLKCLKTITITDKIYLLLYKSVAFFKNREVSSL